MDTTALSPTRGHLNFRLNHTSMAHMPVPSSITKPACQLHRLAYQESQGSIDQKKQTPQGSRAQAALCEACNVHFCIPCWKLYHFKMDLAPHTTTILGKKEWLVIRDGASVYLTPPAHALSGMLTYIS